MPKKPTKWEFTMADSSSGYMINILLYMGAETLDDSSRNTHLPQPARLIVEMMTPYLRCGHHFFTDRYYTNIDLVLELDRHNISFTSTCNKNRKEVR